MLFQRTHVPWALLAVGALVLPLAVPISYYLHLAIIVGIYAIVLLGMDLLVGYTGQVSLGHAAFFGIGAYTAGLLMARLGLPFGLALLAAAVVAACFGVLLAAALRVTGPYLAMVTLAFGTIVQILINEMDWLTLGPIGLAVEKPRLFGEKLSTTQYYYLVIGLLALALVCTSRWAGSHLGRAFEALRDSPIATECMGISVARYKAIAFSLSAAMAGLAGALYAVSEEYISPNTYVFELSLLFLLGVIFGGRKSRMGALLGATVIVLLPTLLDSALMFRWLAAFATAAALYFGLRSLRRHGRAALRSAWPPLLVTAGMLLFSFQVQNLNEHRLSIFGLLILLAVFYLPDGLMGLFRTPVVPPAPAPALADTPLDLGAEAKPLSIHQVSMRFGGLTALDAVDLEVRPGTIHGLIGPNGSGKSTMMNVLTGVYTPSSGRIRLAGRHIQGGRPSGIALQGIARTFQNVQLFWEMTALQNVKVGLHHRLGTNLLALALGSRASRRKEAWADQQAMALLALVGLAGDAATDARDLPYGKQRLLEIARALALRPAILLLDEPAAGLTGPDVAALVQVLRKVKAAGVTMVLIEHHMDMVVALCDTVTVLDFGQKISEGNAQTVRSDPRVVSAYLGMAQA